MDRTRYNGVEAPSKGGRIQGVSAMVGTALTPCNVSKSESPFLAFWRHQGLSSMRSAHGLELGFWAFSLGPPKPAPASAAHPVSAYNLSPNLCHSRLHLFPRPVTHPLTPPPRPKHCPCRATSANVRQGEVETLTPHPLIPLYRPGRREAESGGVGERKRRVVGEPLSRRKANQDAGESVLAEMGTFPFSLPVGRHHHARPPARLDKRRSAEPCRRVPPSPFALARPRTLCRRRRPRSGPQYDGRLGSPCRRIRGRLE